MIVEKEIQTQFFTNEFPGEELEVKLQLLNIDPFMFIYKLYDALCLQEIQGYVVMPTMPGIHEMVYDMETFGVSENQTLKQVFVMVHPLTAGLYRCKTKSPGRLFEASHSASELVTRRHEGKVGGFKTREELISSFKERLGAEPISAGRFIRRKTFIYLTNQKTFRNYCIGGDLCTHLNGKQMSQVEIEYKGIAGMSAPGIIAEHETLEDFSKIVELISQPIPEQIIPTQLTKFDWAKSFILK